MNTHTARSQQNGTALLIALIMAAALVAIGAAFVASNAYGDESIDYSTTVPLTLDWSRDLFRQNLVRAYLGD